MSDDTARINEIVERYDPDQLNNYLNDNIGRIPKADRASYLSSLALRLYENSSFAHAIPVYKLALSYSNNENEITISSLIDLGASYHALANYPQAIFYYNKGLGIAGESGERYGECLCHIGLGGVQYLLSNFQTAMLHFEKALEISKDIGKPREELECYINIGNISHSLFDYDKALSHHEQALEIAKENDNIQQASECYRNLGIAYHALSKYEIAISHIEQALALKIQIGDRVGVTNCYINLGSIHYDIFNYQNAMGYFEQALEIAKQDGNRRGESDCYNNLGTVQYRLSNFQTAISYYEQAIPIKKEIRDKRGESASYMGLGNVHQDLSNFQTAISHYEHALGLGKDVGDKLAQSTCYTNLGNTHYHLSNFQTAISYYEQAIPIKKEIRDKRGESLCYNCLGNVHYDLSNFQKAISYFEQALVIAREIGDKRGASVSYIGLGNVHQYLSNFQKAISYFEQALVIAREISDRFGESLCYNSLGNSHQHLSNFQKAISYFEQALVIAREIGDKRGESLGYIGVGNVHQYLSNFPTAMLNYGHALEIAEKITDRGVETVANRNLGIVLVQVGKPHEAYEHFQKSIKLSEAIGSIIVEDEHKVGYYGRSANTYELIVPLCIELKKKEEAFEFVERSKLKAFIDLMAVRDIELHSKDIKKEMSVLVLKEKDLLDKRRSLQLQSVLSFDPKNTVETLGSSIKSIQTVYNPGEIENIADNLNRIYDEMEQYDPEYVSLRRTKVVPLEKLQRFLKEAQTRAILLEYFITQSKLYLFVLTPYELYIAEVDTSRETIYELIKDYQEEILNFTNRVKKNKRITSRWMFGLSKYLIEPIAKYLKDVDLIYFVPYDRLHYLPFHALLLNGEPLIKNYHVVYTSGASLLRFRSNNDYSLRTCTAYGVALDDDEKEFLEEAEKIADIFGTKAIIDATKEQVLQSLNSDVLHFSCHGYFNYKHPLSSGILLKDSKTITAKEIFSKRIESKLVTLSACETGVSENKPGDELIGLTRSLLYSGAQSVVVSLWPASTLATLKIMIDFYTNLKSGDNKATALQKAQIKTEHELSEKYGKLGGHPFFWAPFILIGDWR